MHLSPRGGQLLLTGHAVPHLCTPHSAALELGRWALAFDADPHGSDLVGAALRGRSARWGSAPRSSLLPAYDGWVLATSRAGPPSNPKASDSRLPRRKEGNVAACAVPGPLPEAVVIFQPHGQLVGVLLQVPLGHGLSSRLTVAGMCLWGSSTLVFSKVRSAPWCGEDPGTAIASGKGNSCILACTCGDSSISLSRAVLTVPCGQDPGKEHGVKPQ